LLIDFVYSLFDSSFEILPSPSHSGQLSGVASIPDPSTHPKPAHFGQS